MLIVIFQADAQDHQLTGGKGATLIQTSIHLQELHQERFHGTNATWAQCTNEPYAQPHPWIERGSAQTSKRSTSWRITQRSSPPGGEGCIDPAETARVQPWLRATLRTPCSHFHAWTRALWVGSISCTSTEESGSPDQAVPGQSS